MATGIISGVADAEMDARLAAYPYVKPHIGTPGAAGTSNPAAETTRKQVTWGSSSGGVAANSAQVTWTAVAATETWTHCSGWSAGSGGACGWTGTISNGALTAGDDAHFAVGALTATTPVAS